MRAADEQKVADLQALSRLAGGLLQAKGQRAALRLAVEALSAALQPDRLSFALEWGQGSTFRVSACIEGPASSGTGSGSDVRFLFAPLRRTGAIVAVLGIASGKAYLVDRRCTLFLETVAEILEVRLNARGGNVYNPSTVLEGWKGDAESGETAPRTD